MKRTVRLVLTAGLLAGLTSCASTVALEVSFPSENAVLISRTANISVVRVEPDMLDVCPRLLGTGTTDPIFEESVPVCDLRSYPLPDPGGGPVAVLVSMVDSTNSVILQGCIVGEVFPGRGPLTVDLFPTSAYTAAAIRDTPPPGTTLSTTCGGGM